MDGNFKFCPSCGTVAAKIVEPDNKANGSSNESANINYAFHNKLYVFGQQDSLESMLNKYFREYEYEEYIFTLQKMAGIRYLSGDSYPEKFICTFDSVNEALDIVKSLVFFNTKLNFTFLWHQNDKMINCFHFNTILNTYLNTSFTVHDVEDSFYADELNVPGDLHSLKRWINNEDYIDLYHTMYPEKNVTKDILENLLSHHKYRFIMGYSDREMHDKYMFMWR